MLNGLQVVERFAKALDREDYVVAASLLAEQCEYLCRGVRHHGPTEIIHSYQANGSVAKLFDAVDYESEVAATKIGQFRIRFIDHLRHGGSQFTFQCEQIINVGESEKIVRIEHCDLPGQVEALSEFKQLLRGRNPQTVSNATTSRSHSTDRDQP